MGANVGRRGPGSGLRQAGTAVEAGQWLRLLEALGSPSAEALLPYLTLRVADAAPLHDACPRAAASLRRILAETGAPDPLAGVNGLLAALYMELESHSGARLARSLFALASDGFPGDAELQVMERWDAPLRALRRDYARSGLAESKRDVVVAMISHHLAEHDALQAALAHRVARGADGERVDWLLSLVQWRRFASLGRALARVLSTAEREQLAAFTRTLAARQHATAQRGVPRAG